MLKPQAPEEDLPDVVEPVSDSTNERLRAIIASVDTPKTRMPGENDATVEE